MKKVGMKTLGLTLGKFAPLHKGHQFMIETALQEVDELIVVIYETTVTLIPLHVRANWIRRLYPEVRVIEAWDGPDGYSDDREHESSFCHSLQPSAKHRGLLSGSWTCWQRMCRA